MSKVYTMSAADQDALFKKMGEKRRILVACMPKDVLSDTIDLIEQYDPTVLTDVQKIEYVPPDEKGLKKMRSLPTNSKPRAKKENRVFKLTAAATK
jgi:hypothetical protein